MELKERIINESTRMFTDEGLKAVRMDDIASELNISKRTLYEMFGDKESLIMACVEHYHDLKHEELKEIIAGADNVVDEFVLILNAWRMESDTNYRLFSSMRKFYPKLFAKYSETRAEEGIRHLKEKLQTGVDQGLFVESLNIDITVTIFLYSMFGFTSQKESGMPHNVSFKDTFTYIVAYFLRGIGTEKGIAIIDERIMKTLNERFKSN